MPTISIVRDRLFERIGRHFSDEDFDEVCFQFGIELDGVEVEKSTSGKEETVYKIDIPANRYDLLCIEGLSQALSVFINRTPAPRFVLVEPESGKYETIHITRNPSQIRPFCLGAVLRDVSLDDAAYDSFIDLQEKLHQNICRKRTLVAIGTHDLDTIKGPFTYDALAPETIKFAPLNKTQEFTAVELMDIYSKDQQLKQYVPIIKDSPVYPVIKDSNGVILSMPPVINGNHTRISTKTKNIFVEITATDLTKAIVVLDTLVAAFSCYCKKPFTVEKVKIVESDGKISFYPKLEYRKETVNADKLNKFIGISETPESLALMLSAMGLKSEVLNKSGEISVEIPPTRHDIIHAVDIYEDAAIGYGYDNIKKTLPRSLTIATQYPVNKLTDQLRHSLAQAGFTEALTFSLCAHDDVTEKLRHPLGSAPTVHISNPKTIEFQVGRTTLLPGLLKTVAANRKMPLPLQLFEVSDVILRDPKKDVGARNERRLCALNYNKTPGFEVIHGLLDRVMTLMQVKFACPGAMDGYYLEPASDETYFPGRCAKIMVHGRELGKIGVLHPEVMAAFELNMPAAAVEINIEPFL